ncbi:alpha/beta hydrolase family protein [Streptococcus intermedius]|uniref:triacylglycerol lipase n=1 Tax=Streptococcus intermedius TaxID=1338 RepID=UPI001CEDC1F8|nr:triacylglycerol lipase [Streptococcus intermedius]
MMATDEQIKWLANQVYSVDSRKNDGQYKTIEQGTYYYNRRDKNLGQFKVLQVEDNHKNGMQAMAVAPLDKNGKPNLSHIVVAYAGTNSSDLKDIQTDIQSIGLGEKRILADSSTKTFRTSQFQTALTFAKEVEKRYPKAKISTTGHSLGESLALYVALKRGYSNLGFNGPDTHNLLSKEEIEYMRKHPEQFRNYRHRYDLIGNIMGDETKTAIYPKIYQGKDELGKKLEYHQLSQWKFNEKGQLVDLDGQVISDERVTAYAETVAGMYRYRLFKKRLSSGGYSGHERIFLDSAQGMVIGDGLEKAAQAGSDEMKGYRTEAVGKAKQLWESIDFSTFQHLSHEEVVGAFASAGVTYNSIVGEVEREFEAAYQKANALASDFVQLNQGIHQVIESKLARDQELAGEFKRWSSDL